MTRAEPLNEWFDHPVVSDESWAIFWTVAAVLVPTLFRASIDGIVEGCHTIPYVPSVLLATIFLGWRHAAVVALASAFVSDWLFMGLLEEACDFFGIGLFLLASALIIGSVELPRQFHHNSGRQVDANERPAGIIFSLEGGQAWASWYGQDTPVRLGPEAEVAEMMQDFLAQLEVGKRLARHPL
jgi:hypothetical protein